MKTVAIPSAFATTLFLGLVSLGVLIQGDLITRLFDLPIVTKIGDTLESSVTEGGSKLVYRLSSNMLTITHYNNETDQVGTVALPLNTLCHTPGVNEYFTCYVCNDDCIYVHNLYGGNCGPNPTSPGNTTCLCADTQAEATARNISKDSKATCNATYQDPNFSKYISDPLLIQILRSRMFAVQCVEVDDNLPTPGYNSTGCIADCVTNHGYTSGVCNKDTPKIASPGYFNQQRPNFCTCSNSTAETPDS